MEQIFIPKQDYKVLVCCFTYNQSKYIEDALNGFVMQQTDFPFLCMVMDDASTDGEQDIIKRWMERECDMINAEYIDNSISIIILTSHKVNPFCFFVFYLLKQNLYANQEKKQKILSPWRKICDYEAVCEGDDYWIDPLKLQKQVDILDSNFNYSFCHTGFSFYYQEKNKFESCPPVPSFSNAIEKMIAILDYNRYRVQTNTVLMRREALNRVYTNNDCFDKRFFMGDTQLWVLLLEQGDCYYLEDNTAVYRINEESTCRSRDYKKQLRFWISSEEMRLYLFNRLNYHCGVYDKVYDSYLKKCYEYKQLDSSFQPMFDLKISNYFDYFRFVLKYQYRKLKHKIFS